MRSEVDAGENGAGEEAKGEIITKERERKVAHARCSSFALNIAHVAFAIIPPQASCFDCSTGC
jgi:hypothetical protein